MVKKTGAKNTSPQSKNKEANNEKNPAIALIMFQLIGCAKQPVVIARPESEQGRETPQHRTPQGGAPHGDTPQAPKTSYMQIVGGGLLVGIPRSECCCPV
jgi:hypothetical protein